MFYLLISSFYPHSKHVLEDQTEEDPGISPETSFVAEHERLAAEYYNERALLEEALRKSQDASRNASDDESAEEIQCTSHEKEPVEKFRPLRRFEPLNPIPISEKESNEDGVFNLNLLASK